jgi:O-antigen ligase
LTVLFFFIVLFPFFSTRFEAHSRLEQKSIEERFIGYSFFDDLFFQNPLFGTGPGTYTVALAKVNPGQSVWNYQPIHNSFLLFLLEVGVPVSLCFIMYIFQIFKGFKKQTEKKHQIFIFGGLTFFFILGLFDHYLWSLWPGISLFFLSLVYFLHQDCLTEDTL